ncbi:MAG: hypothetical protein KA346_07520 [Neisseriaceae bacterium]|nr:hypothetical protein [Neisseriaceae bacterium]
MVKITLSHHFRAVSHPSPPFDIAPQHKPQTLFHILFSPELSFKPNNSKAYSTKKDSQPFEPKLK